MTVKEFWESKECLAIQCNTEEKAKKLFKRFSELGKKWETGDNYSSKNIWWIFEEDTCYDNKGYYCYKEYYESKKNIKVIDFDDLEDFKLKSQDREIQEEKKYE